MCGVKRQICEFINICLYVSIVYISNGIILKVRIHLLPIEPNKK